MYEAVTYDILVRVTPRFIKTESSAETSRYFWAYTVEIENHGPVTVTLHTRRWEITDGLGRHQVVEGTGVVGETPTLEPGETYSYTSGCPLPTPSGIMKGKFGMHTVDGDIFDIDIPTFSLDVPDDTRIIH